ncbi:MAG: carboxymuconolactone decarboxylase family protein [Myxococcales bacterium]|nr:carboxymuconolactone decarboxylase family protein [Myxococcales bacterium]
MSHVPVPPSVPGILGLFAFRPETAGPLNMLAEALLRGPSSLSRGERELIAAFVSSRNGCRFCCDSHAAFAAHQLDGGYEVVEAALEAPDTAPVSNQLRHLLAIAAEVQRSGREVRPETIEAARVAGADDVAIHDTVLIAAAFCMFNRYVDGLATTPAPDRAAYDQMAELITTAGYVGASAAMADG